MTATIIWLGVLVVSPGTAYGATHGIFTVTATPYYIHPVTGVIEDSGQNPGIGQGMTESVLSKEALLEVEADGTHYVTVRFALMDNISDVKIAVQKDAESAFKDVSYTITKENMQEATADIRFEVPDEKAIARSSFYVGPMGRDVVFFMTFSDPKPGSGDFVTNIEVDEALAAEQAANSTDDASQEIQTPETTAANVPAANQNDGLTIYENDEGAKEKGGGNVILFAVAVVVIVAAVAACGLVYYRKKKSAASRRGEDGV
jgi:hypothetical protein